MYRAVMLFSGPERPFGGCEIYRGAQPLYTMQQFGEWQTRYMYLRTLLEESAKAPNWMTPLANVLRGTDVLVFSRSAVPFGADQHANEFMSMARRFGCSLVYETDDDYSNVHRQVTEGDVMSVASRCDALTVTTQYLGETMHKHTGLPYYVLPNMVSPLFWKTSKVTRLLGSEYVSISLSGTKTHYDDWKVLKDVLPAILQKHPHARLFITGFHPDYLQGLPNTEYFPPLRYQDYAAYTRTMDIVLAPVDPLDGFNLGKSPVKAIEGMAAARTVRNRLCGAAVIATDNPIYRLAVNNGENGILVPFEAQAWYEALDKLLTDADERFRLQASGYDSVWKRFDITKGWKLWDKAYRQIIQSARSKTG